MYWKFSSSSKSIIKIRSLQQDCHVKTKRKSCEFKKKLGILNIFRYFQYFLSYPFLSYCYTLCNIFINLKIINEYYVYLFRNITVFLGKVGVILTGHYMFAEEGKKNPSSYQTQLYWYPNNMFRNVFGWAA